ncbi:unnamed protein product [Urochloa humidicola]
MFPCARSYAETSPPLFFVAVRCAGDLPRPPIGACPSSSRQRPCGDPFRLAPVLLSGHPRSFPHRPTWHPGPNSALLQPWMSRCGGRFHRWRPRQPGDEVALTRPQHFPSRGGVDPGMDLCVWRLFPSVLVTAV